MTLQRRVARLEAKLNYRAEKLLLFVSFKGDTPTRHSTIVYGNRRWNRFDDETDDGFKSRAAAEADLGAWGNIFYMH